MMMAKKYHLQPNMFGVGVVSVGEEGEGMMRMRQSGFVARIGSVATVDW